MFYNAYPNRKDWRKPYYGNNNPKNVDYWCRNHGSCVGCVNNRLYQYIKAKMGVEQDLEDFFLWVEQDTRERQDLWKLDMIGAI